MQLYRLIYYY